MTYEFDDSSLLLPSYDPTNSEVAHLQARVAELEAALQMVRSVHEQTNPDASSWVEVRRVLGVE